jgi:hypothetical protein
MKVAFESKLLEQYIFDLVEELQHLQKINRKCFDETNETSYFQASTAYSHASVKVSEIWREISRTPGNVVAKDDKGNQYFIISK